MEDLLKQKSEGNFIGALKIAEELQSKNDGPSNELLFCTASLLYELGQIKKCHQTLKKVKFQQFDLEELVLENNLLLCEYKETVQVSSSNPLLKILQQFERLIERIHGLPSGLPVILIELGVVYNYCTVLITSTSQWKHTRAACALSSAILKAGGFNCPGQLDDSIVFTTGVCNDVVNAFQHTEEEDMNNKLMSYLRLCGILLSMLWITENKVEESRNLLNQIICSHKKEVCKINEAQKDNNILFLTRYTDLSKQGKDVSLPAFAYFLLACCEYLCDENDQAMCSLDQCLEFETNFLQACFVKGLILFKQGKENDSMSWFVKCSESAESDQDLKASSLNMLGCCCMKQGKPFTALQKLKEAIECNFHHFESLYNVSLVYHSVQQHDVELEALKFLLKCKDCKDKELLEMSTCHLMLQILGKIPCCCLVGGYQLSEALQENNILYRLAKHCVDLNRFEESADYYLELIAVCRRGHVETINKFKSPAHSLSLPPPSVLYQECIKSLLHAGRYEDALTLCDKSLISLGVPQETQEQNTQSYKEYDRTGKRQRSEKESNNNGTKEEIISDEVVLLFMKTDALTHLHQLDKAIICLDRLIEVLGGTWDVGQITESSVEESEKQKHKRRKLDNGEVNCSDEHADAGHKNSLLAQAYNNKAMILLGQGQNEVALDLLRQSLQYHTDSSAFYNHTLLLLKLNKAQEACSNWFKFRGYSLTENQDYYKQELKKIQLTLRSVPSSVSSTDRVSDHQLYIMDKVTLNNWWKITSRKESSQVGWKPL